MARGRATVRQIAIEAGVSAATVSRAISSPGRVSEQTLARVHEAISRLSEDAAARGPRQTATLGLIFADETSGPRFGGFDAALWAGIAQAAIPQGAELVLLNIDHRRPAESIADLCRRRGIDAIALRVDGHPDRIIREVAGAGLPSIVLAHRHDHPDAGFVCCDSGPATREAAEHLIGLGHRRIAFCSNVAGDQDHEDRYLAYRAALDGAGIATDESIVLRVPADAEGGVASINRLLADPRPPTAVMYADPIPTVGALRRLAELGLRAPADMSIVGFDDDADRLLGSPVFTAVRQDVPGIGRLCGRLLCRMAAGLHPGPPPRITLAAFFEVNATTGPAPRSGG